MKNETRDIGDIEHINHLARIEEYSNNVSIRMKSRRCAGSNKTNATNRQKPKKRK